MLKRCAAAALSAASCVAVAASAAGPATAVFPTELSANQMVASQLIGTTVVGAGNEVIGDVNDIVLDRASGRTVAVAVGVGGFLGIGEKVVAVPFDSLDFDAPLPAAEPGSAAATGTVAPAPLAVARDGVPRRIVLKMTKAELQGAPAFRSARKATK